MKTIGIRIRRTRLFWAVFFTLPAAFARAQDGGEACRETRTRFFGTPASKSARVQYPGDAGIDVTYYKLDLRITYTPAYLRGAVTVGLKSSSATVSQFFLDLSDSLRVDSVRAGTQKLAFTRQPGRLLITPAQPLSGNQVLSVIIYYQGRPGATGQGSFTFGSHGSQREPAIWSLSEPYGAPDWFPCKDNPADKADSSDVWITAPKQFVSVSNGRLEGTTDHADNTRTYRWRNRYPIANYLISVAMTNYVRYERMFRPTPVDSMPVTHYIYPEALTPTLMRTLDETNQMLEVFTRYFGPYPFLKEKYGHAQFGWGGGMEHQTISSMGTFDPNVIAHELAHQWFGDKITCRSWEHIWLNEGFASYAEALYREAVGGPSGYQGYMNNFMNRARLAQGTLFVRDISNSNNIFNSNRTYSKGAVVLHMLRGIVGEPKFRQILQTYAHSEFAYGTATTEDFAAIASRIYGQSLDYFFKEWVYGENFPTYRATWTGQPTASGTWSVQLRLEQSTGTSNPAFFTMPVPVRVRTAAGDTVLTVFNDRADQVFELPVKSRPTEVQIDPENWILKQVESVSLVLSLDDPISVTQLTVSPNPVTDRLTLQIEVGQPFRGKLSLLTMQGQGVAFRPEQAFSAGRQTIFWSLPPLPAGRYLLTLYDGRKRLTKAVLITN